MSTRLCEIPGCGHVYLARGMCRMHYERDRRGVPLEVTPISRQSAEARFWSKVDRRASDECWNWTGGLAGRDVAAGGGYGWFQTDGSQYAHRFAYALLVGPIPDGFQIDHLCRNRRCVNPAHLEAVTQAENIRRGYAARRAS